MAAAKEVKFGTKVVWGEDDAQMLNTRISQRKCTIPHLTMKNMTCITSYNIEQDCIIQLN